MAPFRARAKGDAAERFIANLIKSRGFDAKRMPLSGAVKGFEGDCCIYSRHGTWFTRDILLQVKCFKNGSGFRNLINQISVNCQVFGFKALSTGEEYVCMNFGNFALWLRGELFDTPASLMSIGGKGLTDAIKGHDVFIGIQNGGEMIFAMPLELFNKGVVAQVTFPLLGKTGT